MRFRFTAWLERSWYGPGEPRLCFIERKTHRESWKGEKSVKERFTLPEPKVGLSFFLSQGGRGRLAACVPARAAGCDAEGRTSSVQRGAAGAGASSTARHGREVEVFHALCSSRKPTAHVDARPPPQVVPYLEGEYTAEHFREDLRAKVGWVVVQLLRAGCAPASAASSW